MMDRAEKAGLGVAITGHVLLFGLLSVGFLAAPKPPVPAQPPVEVSLVRDVAPEAAAPAATPPAASVAPDVGDPEDAAPPEVNPVPEPQPDPPAPQPAPVKPAPAKPAPPKSAPPKPAPAKPVPTKPSPPKPAPPKPVPAPLAKPAATPRPHPPAAEQAATKPAPVKPAPVKTAASAAPSRAAPAKAVGRGSDPAKPAGRPRGSRLGDNFLAGLATEPTRSTATAPSAAKAGPFPTASIQQAIARQIQPCADRQVNPGPGANQIVTTLNIRLNADGTLSATPRMVRQTGVDDGNDRYAQRVVDLGIAAFKGCTPLKLPAQYYATAAGGWNTINYQWQLR